MNEHEHEPVAGSPVLTASGEPFNAIDLALQAHIAQFPITGTCTCGKPITRLYGENWRPA